MHQPYPWFTVVAECLAVGLACGDHRWLTGNASWRCAIQIHVLYFFTRLIQYKYSIKCILVTWLGTNCNTMSTSPTSHVAFLRPPTLGDVIALNTWQEVIAIIATCFIHHQIVIHCVDIKKCHWFFHNNFYKYAQIFMIFGTLLCKWILIILVNLLCCVPCTSPTWWHNVDITEIMPFTVHVTLSLCCREGCQILSL